MAERGSNPHETDLNGISSSPHATRQEWEQLHSDPDLHEDLGYDLMELESYEAEGERVLFLPRDEDMIREDAFIIVHDESLQTLDE